VIDDSADAPAGSGLLATVYFRVHGTTPDTVLTLDTTWIGRNSQLHFTDTTFLAAPIIPEFTAGRVTIEAAGP
jgi:hypothetical protein